MLQCSQSRYSGIHKKKIVYRTVIRKKMYDYLHRALNSKECIYKNAPDSGQLLDPWAVEIYAFVWKIFGHADGRASPPPRNIYLFAMFNIFNIPFQIMRAVAKRGDSRTVQVDVRRTDNADVDVSWRTVQTRRASDCDRHVGDCRRLWTVTTCYAQSANNRPADCWPSDPAQDPSLTDSLPADTPLVHKTPHILILPVRHN